MDLRYRIVGKVRLAVFWASRDVGSARLTWRSDGATTTMAMLAGSDPLRAPRRLNQWAYMREEIRSDQGESFIVRSLDGAPSSAGAPLAPGSGPLFGVSCASVGDRSVRSTRTIVNGEGVTYRMFGALLNHATAAREWEEDNTPRPAGADAGFLTALQHILEAAESTPGGRREIVSYVYNNTIYELRLRERQLLGRDTVGTRTFERLIRAELAMRNRTTGDVTRFAVTYSTEGAGVALPVQIFYQPNFWLGIELRLDDEVDAPADPATDASTLMRIRDLCGSVAD